MHSIYGLLGLQFQVFEIKEIKEVGNWLVFLKFPGGLNPRGEIHEGRWHFCAFVFSLNMKILLGFFSLLSLRTWPQSYL